MQKLFLSTIVIFFTGFFFLQQTKAQSGNTHYGEAALELNTGTNNTGIGYYALKNNSSGSNNSALGGYALNANTTGYNNNAFGVNALRSNTVGYNNSAFGNYALFSNTVGSNNSAFGFDALIYNTTGKNNSAFGSGALYLNSTGSYNSAVGLNTLFYNSKGIRNTASGYEALKANTTGNNNTATGMNAMHFNTSGSHNTANGNYALERNKTGSGNTAIGDSAGARYNTYNNSTFIGYKTTSTAAFNNVTVIGFQASATASNQVRIGNTAVTSIGGKVSWTTLSDGRFKRNIKEDVPGLTFITKLRPVTYLLDNEAIDKANGFTKQPQPEQMLRGTSNEKHTGFVAQEVEETAKKMGYEFDGVDKPKNDKDFYGLRYAEFVVPLVKAVQELAKENDELKSRLEKLEGLLSAQSQTESLQNIQLTGAAKLEQNTPNPFNDVTKINYYLPSDKGNAYINFYSSTGQILKSVKIASGGKGTINVNINDLPSGVYQYALLMDGRIIDKKQMLKVK